MQRRLRYRDLHEKGIVTNRVTLEPIAKLLSSPRISDSW